MGAEPRAEVSWGPFSQMNVALYCSNNKQIFICVQETFERFMKFRKLFDIYSYVSLNNDILVQDFKRRVHVNKKTIVSLIHYEIKLK